MSETLQDGETQAPAAAEVSRGEVLRESVLRLAALVGIGVSSALLVDYVAPQAVFCNAVGSGCDLVRHSRFAYPLGVPLPLLGIGFFTAMIAVSVAGRSPTLRRALAGLGLVSVLSAAALVAIQGVILHAWCRFCLVVDAASLVAGVMALSLIGAKGARNSAAGAQLRARLAVALAFAFSVGPLGWGLTQRPPPRETPVVTLREVPEVVLREQRAGVATIVEFVDFECPFCRRQQAAMEPILASYGRRVRVVRKNVPLSFHVHARDAARAACCAEEQGRGDRVAGLLFHTEDLSAEGCDRAAQEAGVDMAAYRACLASQRPEARLERDTNDARAAGVSGLPTLFIGRERFEGLQEAEAVRASIDRALSGPASGGS
ncbi:MAG: vitamin K epoxide reductase family protein [Myxococcales bacterium]|nr:vitamin K epoxide reductase family protein [Myxococcales bacterium]